MSPHAKRTQSVVLDSVQTIAFLSKAKADDAIQAKDLFGSTRRLGRDQIVNRYQSEVLTSCLLYRPIHLLVPPRAAEVLDLSAFRNEGIPVVMHTPYDQEDLSRLNTMFSGAFDAIRLIERDYRVSPVMSYEALIQDNFRGSKPHDPSLWSSDLEFTSNVETYNDFVTLLTHDIDWLRCLSPELFDLFMHRHTAAYETFMDVHADVIELRESKGSNRRTDTDSILGLMDLKIRNPDHLVGDTVDVFPREFFSDFEHYADLWQPWRTDSFENQVERAFYVELCDPTRFARVFAFWNSWLELKRLIALSVDERAAIKLPPSMALHATYPVSADENKLQLFKLYLREVNTVPAVNSFPDLFRLYNHKYLDRFREQLDLWDKALYAGSPNAVAGMKRDFNLAIKDLAKVAKMQKVGDLLTYIGLPIALAAPLLKGLPVDFGLAAIGPALLGYTKLLERRASWVRFGDAE